MTKSTLSKITAGVLAIVMIGAQTATAAGLLSVSDTMTNEQVSSISDHSICFQTPTGVNAGQTITYTFPAQFNMGTFAIGNFDFKTGASCAAAASETIAASASGTTWGVAQAGQVVTVTSGTDTIAANQFVVLDIIGQITNPATTQSGGYIIDIAGTFADSASLAVPILADDTVVITAKVEPYINFAITGTGDYVLDFGDLNSSGAKWAIDTTGGAATETVGHGMTADTNATGGYTITVLGGTLTSGAGDTIDAIGATATASTPGTEQFGMRVTTTGGSTAPTIASPYNNATNYGGGAETATTTVATVAAPTTTNSYDVYYLANISTTTDYGLYQTAKTYIATGNF